jgi:hypothetical protein
MVISMLARQMLAAAYAEQLTDAGGGGHADLNVKAWAEGAGHGVEEADQALAELRERGLLRSTSLSFAPDVRLETAGVEAVEREGMADHSLIARQFDLRRDVLNVLEEDRAADPDGKGGSMLLPSVAVAVGESRTVVLFALQVLNRAGLIEHGDGGSRTARISPSGRDALARGQIVWPLSSA